MYYIPAIAFFPLRRADIRCDDSGQTGEFATVLAVGHLAPTPLCPEHASDWVLNYTDPHSEYYGAYEQSMRERLGHDAFGYMEIEYVSGGTTPDRSVSSLVVDPMPSHR